MNLVVGRTVQSRIPWCPPSPREGSGERAGVRWSLALRTYPTIQGFNARRNSKGNSLPILLILSKIQLTKIAS
jgi:hypothetical protein